MIAATQIMPKTRFGGRPSTWALTGPPPAGGAGAMTSGAGRKKINASGTITMTTVAPYQNIVWRQPIVPSAHSNTGGHTAPAR